MKVKIRETSEILSFTSDPTELKYNLLKIVQVIKYIVLYVND